MCAVLGRAYCPAEDALPRARPDLDKGLTRAAARTVPWLTEGPARRAGRPWGAYLAVLKKRSDLPAVAIGRDMANSALNEPPDEVSPS